MLFYELGQSQGHITNEVAEINRGIFAPFQSANSHAVYSSELHRKSHEFSDTVLETMNGIIIPNDPIGIQARAELGRSVKNAKKFKK